MWSRMILFVINYVVLSACIIVTPAHLLIEQVISDDYDPDSRSMPHKDYITTVTIVPNMFILLAMDQLQETILFLEEFILIWNDPFLTWNKSEVEYAGDWIKVPERKVWSPDVIFENSVSIEHWLDDDERMIDLKYDGTLRQSNPALMEVSDFPYDVQVCELYVGPWNYEKHEVVMTSSIERIDPDPLVFEGNSEWDLVSIEAEMTEKTDVVEAKMYSYIKYNVTLKRKPVYYVLVLQAPTFIVTTLTIFGIFTPFNITEERREKVTLSLNMFVSVSIMLTLISEMMPKASRLPLLGNYILAEIFVCGIAVVVSIGILTAHQKCSTRLLRPSKWICRIVFLNCTSKKNKPVEPKENSAEPDSNLSATIPDILQSHPLKSSIEKTTKAIRSELLYEEAVREIRGTWLKIFDRIDVLCLIIFQVLNIVASYIFMR